MKKILMRRILEINLECQAKPSSTYISKVLIIYKSINEDYRKNLNNSKILLKSFWVHFGTKIDTHLKVALIYFRTLWKWSAILGLNFSAWCWLPRESLLCTLLQFELFFKNYLWKKLWHLQTSGWVFLHPHDVICHMRSPF